MSSTVIGEALLYLTSSFVKDFLPVVWNTLELLLFNAVATTVECLPGDKASFDKLLVLSR